MDIKMRTLLTLTIIIAMTSCEKDGVDETPTTNETTNTVQDNDTIVALELEEDTIISRVGCYYPMYEPGYKETE